MVRGRLVGGLVGLVLVAGLALVPGAGVADSSVGMTFRPPTWKPNEGKYHANFEYWIGVREGKPFGNGHPALTDMIP